MNNPEIIVVVVTCFLLFFLDLIFESIVFNKFSKLSYRVDDLEKQIAHISKTSAEFFCAINNRIADISTAFDCCDTNIDTLFDEKNKINESITDLKRSVDCINCKLLNPLTRFIK